MLFLALTLSVFLFVGFQQQNNKSHPAQQSSQTDQRGTENAPLVVRMVPSPKTSEEVARDKENREAKTVNDRNLVYLTAILAIVGFLQLLVFGY